MPPPETKLYDQTTLCYWYFSNTFDNQNEEMQINESEISQRSY